MPTVLVPLNTPNVERLLSFIIADDNLNATIGEDLVDRAIQDVLDDVNTMKTVATVTFDPVTETELAENDTVTLATETADAVIRYTVDGSTPNLTSEVYTEPIVVTEGVTIKAIAYKGYQTRSVAATATYTIGG